ncbi:cupin domain-containing protein [Paenibacillus agricola]|uniref:Cupin domain-containing protein n=1 Tax=Paenibacillus agricola TaxID=2716264 RepID=A0ABX0JBZ5_9BACL|nr:cupin domain-containing protein [Paenibacillus agricola]NHN33677.1 cupin domain-containing protein [Paenibacillus agricola]
MYYVPQTYSNPYYANDNTPLYHPGYTLRNQQEYFEQGFEAILAGIKREASAIDLYSRLAHAAPNHNHKNNILYALEDKKVHLNQFTNIYITLTGRQPIYQTDKVHFRSYREGLTKAHEAGIQGYEEYRKNGLLIQYPPVQNVFLHASSREKENAARFASLNEEVVLKDYGSKPFVVNIDKVTKQNNTYRTALWTGKHFQVTVMSISVGDDIGLEVHPTTDQFIRIEEGQGLVQMGDSKDKLDFEEKAYNDYAIMIPAGKWHNVTNTGNKPLKIYVIYAPPQHPYGTVHGTKKNAMASEENH